METAESFLRVAGIVITGLMALLLLRDAGQTLVGRLAATFSLGVAAYIVCSSSSFHALSPYIHLPISRARARWPHQPHVRGRGATELAASTDA